MVKRLPIKKHNILINTKCKVIYGAYLLALICSCVGEQLTAWHFQKKTLKIFHEWRNCRKFTIVAESLLKNKIFNS